jgi:predicted nucleic acid-binding protein
MKKIYLDVCSLCRPFDDQNFIRIRLETDAVNLILSKVKQNYYQLMKSKAHIIEINAITEDIERFEILELLKAYGKFEGVNNNTIKNRIEELSAYNFSIADAAHIAFSENYNSVFITCDDKLLSKCNKYIKSIRCVNPVTFCEMESLK